MLLALLIRCPKLALRRPKQAPVVLLKKRNTKTKRERTVPDAAAVLGSWLAGSFSSSLLL